MAKTIFEALKRQETSLLKGSSIIKFFFQISEGESGPYIRIVDSKFHEVDPSPYLYSARERQLLQLIKQLKEKNSMAIDWEGKDNHLYTEEHDYLIPLFKGLKNLINHTGEPLILEDVEGEFRLHLEETEKTFAARILFHIRGNTHKDFKLLSRQYVMIDNTIYPAMDLGNNYHLLELFNTKILKTQIEPFLSLFYSNFDQIEACLPGYIFEKGEKRNTLPTLIIRDVDEDKTLQLEIKALLPDFPDDFLIHYDIHSIVSVDEIEKKIVLHELLYIDLSLKIREMEKLLKKLKSQADGSGDYYSSENLFIIDKEIARLLIYEHLTELMSGFSVLGEEKLKIFNVRTVEPELNLSLSHGIDFLEGSIELDIEGSLFSLSDLFKEIKKQSYIPLSDGSHGIINKSYLDKLHRLFLLNNDAVKISFFDLPLVEELIGDRIAEAVFPKAREIFRGFNELKNAKPEFPELKGTLREYQKYGFVWMDYLHSNKLGGCLADDMGLGKTIQAIALLNKIYPEEGQPSLIIMPTTLLDNWKREIEKFSPGLSFYVYHGLKRDFPLACRHSVILTTYGTVRNDIRTLKDYSFHAVILDESQKIKNISSGISKAVMLLSAECRLALSGTPIENNLFELYALFRFLNPSMFGSLENFSKKFAAPVQKENDKNAMRELRKKIYPFILRRTKKAVLKELPDKIEQVLYTEMDRELTLYYEDRRRMYYDAIRNKIGSEGLNKSKFFILQALSELRQIASIPERQTDGQMTSPKLDLLIDQLIDTSGSGHKSLVFVNYLDAISLIGERLEQEGIEFLTMSGSTRNRGDLVNEFQNNEHIKVFIITLKTGGVGLNLTAADYVFIFDPWWNQAAENQAVDRTHRIGQKNTVFSYKLITSGTIEEKILQLQEKKRELFDDLLSSEGEAIKKLDEEDIDYIFKE
ncbi:MAG: DEAD/DEAH box helicase [Spirochaetales bacterium]|nr:DEAD/DEAH box helicase [Spirochaetales bacterium]